MIETVVSTCEQRFYDPQLHGVSVRDLLGREQSRLLRTSTFTTDINTLLARLEAYPVEFGHESERRVGLWKAIKCSFFRWNGAWIFQDVLIGGHACAAGVRSGAALIAVDDAEVSQPDIPRFRPSARVKVTFKNPGESEQSFEFDPTEKEDENKTQYVEHRRLDERVGYIRVSKFPGILGMGIAKEIDSAIRALRNPDALVIDMRGNLGSVGAGNLRLMSYLTPDRIPVGYSLTRARAQQGYRREELAQFTEIPRLKLLAPLTLLKFKDGDKSITVVTEGLGKKSFHGRIVMLVNEHTISGGEIVAGFATDHKMATLVGSPTAGKLLGWASISVGHECFLTLPTVNYMTWEGRTFERTGVIPDHHVPFSPEAAIGGIDNQLAAAAELARTL
ncbi:MAG TPA: S41 family peptidase [Bryobacteraceae bacterium]|nr:S41 family peptidase [Bryobacteraceae bacterium]